LAVGAFGQIIMSRVADLDGISLFAVSAYSHVQYHIHVRRSRQRQDEIF